MNRNIKLSVITETGENLIITVKSNETFAEFQQRIIVENNLFVNVEDFQSLDANLNQETVFFECLRNYLNDDDALNFDGPLFQINLSKYNVVDNFTETVEDYCRLCAEYITPNKIQINEYIEQINKHFSIHVKENDGLPQNICVKCSAHLQNMTVFANQIIEADKVLKVKFNVKTEDEEYFEIEEIEQITNTPNHHCRICDLIIDNLKDALLHSSQDHRINNLYACVFCEYGFETTVSLSQHIQCEHKDFNKFICKICGTRFAYQTMLQKHVCISSTFVETTTENIIQPQENNNKVFQCHICGKSLHRLSRLKSHLLQHESNNLIYKNINCCVDCKEGFENETKATLHYNENDEKHTVAIAKLNKVFRCEFCEKCYIDINGLKMHRSIHNGANPFICHVCGAQFMSYSRCTSHKTSHGLFKEGGDKQIFPVIKYFLCDSCDNTYLNWTHLTSHKKQKHSTLNKTYKCLDCNLEFPNSYGLNYHRRTKHMDESIKCTECGEDLANYEAWKTHRLAVHANKKYNYQCVKCEKIFQTPEKLEEHLKIHTDVKENKCPYCPSSYAAVKDLGTHLKIHRLKKSHLAQNPIKSTDNERPYSCPDCGLTFRKQFTLKNHQLKHCIKLDNSKFVLMVDDEEQINSQTSNETTSNDHQQNTNQINEQYIDLGNGNYVQIQPGNTVNIEGKDYVLVNDQLMAEDTTNVNLNLEENVMQVDDPNTNQYYLLSDVINLL